MYICKDQSQWQCATHTYTDMQCVGLTHASRKLKQHPPHPTPPHTHTLHKFDWPLPDELAYTKMFTGAGYNCSPGPVEMEISV